MADKATNPLTSPLGTARSPLASSADRKAPDDPWKILSTFPGNQEGALAWGDREHREAYVQIYGYEQTLGIINKVLEDSIAVKGNGRGGGEWYKELEDYRNELLARQGY